jgi:hypothetical protein
MYEENANIKFQNQQNQAAQPASQVDALIHRLSTVLSGLKNTGARVDGIANRVIGFESDMKAAQSGGAPAPVASSALDLVGEIEHTMALIDRHLARIDR